MAFEYSRAEFEALIEDGEWVPTDEDRENEVYRTPDGELPYQRTVPTSNAGSSR